MRSGILYLTATVAVTFMLSSCLSREERNRRAEEEARGEVEVQASRVKGVGEALKGVGKDAMQSLAEGVGSVVKGASEGFDKSTVSIDMRVSDEAKTYFSSTRTQVETDSLGKQEIISYLTFNRACKGKLVLKLFNKTNKEVGRSVVAVNMSEEEARYIDFPVDQRISFSLIEYCTLEYKP